MCQACRRIFSRQGFEVEVEHGRPAGPGAGHARRTTTIILLDIKMPNMDGIQFLEQLREKKPDVPVLIITGYPSIPNAAAAMRLGACDYVTKPFTSEEITWAVQRVLAHARVPAEAKADGCRRRWRGGDGRQAASRPLFWDESLGAAGGRRFGVRGRGAAGAPRRRRRRASACRGSAKWCTRACRWPA